MGLLNIGGFFPQLSTFLIEPRRVVSDPAHHPSTFDVGVWVCEGPGEEPFRAPSKGIPYSNSVEGSISSRSRV
jgi:hypothetical protein